MLTIKELTQIATELIQKVPEFASGTPALHIGEPIMYFDTLIVKDGSYRSCQPMQYAERKRVFDIIGEPYAQMDEEVRAEQIAKYPPSNLTSCIHDLEEDYNRIAMRLHTLSPKGKDYTPECNQHIHNLRFRKFRYSRDPFCTTSKMVDGFIKMRHAANEISRILLETPNIPEEMRKCAEELVQLEEIAKSVDDEICQGNFL